MLRVLIAGVTGWTGAPLAEAVEAAGDLELAGGIARSGADHGSVEDALAATEADVLVDFTKPGVVRGHVDAALVGRGLRGPALLDLARAPIEIALDVLGRRVLLGPLLKCGRALARRDEQGRQEPECDDLHPHPLLCAHHLPLTDVRNEHDTLAVRAVPDANKVACTVKAFADD